MQIKKPLYILILVFFSFQSIGQSSYMAFYAGDFMKRKRTVENSITENIEEISRRNLWMCAQYYVSTGSDWFFKVDASYIALLATAPLYKKDAAFNVGIFDMRVNKSFNPNRPISMGPIDWRIGMGISLGIPWFDNNASDPNAFLSYGFSIHNTFDIGENFQITYFNNLAFSYNPRYEKMVRTSHEFYIMYNADWFFQPTITPYVETYRFTERGNSDYLDVTHRYLGFKIGVVHVMD